MAFFLTMPISRMMPMIAMMLEIVAGDDQRQQRADAGRRQRGKDRDRVNEALVENSQHDIHGDDRGKDQQQLIAERRLKGQRRALEMVVMLAGMPISCSRAPDRIDGLAERGARRQIEGDRGRGKLAEVIDLQRRRLLLHMRNGRERHLAAAAAMTADRSDSSELKRVLQSRDRLPG